MARDPDTIQREIEQARDALADSLDALAERANPKHFVDAGKESVQARLADPRIRYGLIGARRPAGLRPAPQALPLTQARPVRGRVALLRFSRSQPPAAVGQGCGPSREGGAVARASATGASPRRAGGSGPPGGRRRSPPPPPAGRPRGSRPPCRAPAPPSRPAPCSGTTSSAQLGPAEELDLEPELVGPEVGHRRAAGAARRGCRGPRRRPGRRRWSSARGGAGRRGPGRPMPRRRRPPRRPSRPCTRPGRAAGEADADVSSVGVGEPVQPRPAADADDGGVRLEPRCRRRARPRRRGPSEGSANRVIFAPVRSSTPASVSSRPASTPSSRPERPGRGYRPAPPAR